jgi:hypothetical protein
MSLENVEEWMIRETDTQVSQLRKERGITTSTGNTTS